MTPERYQQAKEIFHAALDRAPGERSAFLASACGGDELLRKEVESLISSHEKDGSFIDSPAYEAAAELLTTDKELIVGQKVGHYEILSTLGKGGMGEVYLASDTKLGRKVALKLLPSEFTSDSDRLRRFEQEARAVSALNHPHILTIHEIGEANGRRFIATEFVDGQTLRHRLSRAVTIDEALVIAEQIASALASAHAAGIIHRDIKPENIMLRRDGYAKLLDFGLAKLVEHKEAGSEDSTRALIQTGSGLVMGTVAYMSPEQARGLPMDARTDIWSLGVVLYEMICGRQPFAGATTSDVLVSVLERDPQAFALVAPSIPETLEFIITKALTKEREERYQTAREFLSDLRRLKQKLNVVAAQTNWSPTPPDVSESPGDQTANRSTVSIGAVTNEPGPTRQTNAPRAPRRWKRNWTTLALILLAVVVLAVGTFWVLKRPGRDAIQDEAGSKVVRTSQITFSPGLDGFPSFSPDGNSIVYSSDQKGSFEIYVKQLASGGAELQLTSDGQQNSHPSWSPDGQRIAYYSKTRGGIWVMSALGGSPKQLTEFGSSPTWSSDGSMIAFQSGGSSEGFSRQAMPPSTIWIIPSQGGTARRVTQPGNPRGGHSGPSWSPDAKRIAFAASDYLSSSVWTVSVEDGNPKEIARGANPIYAPDGQHIYCLVEAGLSKIQISQSGEPTGESELVLSRSGKGIVNPRISADGKKIVYGDVRTLSNLWSVSLSPASSEVSGSPVPFTRDTSQRNNLARFSPDGRKLALTRWRPGTSGDIWVADSDGGNLTQLTTDPGADSQPNWLPEGNKLVFLTTRDNNHPRLWTISLLTGKEEPFLDLGDDVEFAQLSPDGKQVVFNTIQNGSVNIWVVNVQDGRKKQLTFDDQLMGFGSWSPDGQFIAFEMRRGDDDYLAVVPSSGGQITQLTFDHGRSWPHGWSPDGDKITFAGQRNGVWNIYWISRSTKVQKQLTSYSKQNAFVRYPAWSPLGDKIVYEYAETTGNVWLMELN